jgi:FAD/FMN-containing dehydrogenase
MTIPPECRRPADGAARRGVRPFRPANFCWPKTSGDVEACVCEAIKRGAKIRVRGSQHSEAGAVYTTDFDAVGGPPPWDDGKVNLILDDLLSFDAKGGEIAVGAGHHLGEDPYAVGPARDPVNSLVHKLDRNDLALPELGGISHQSLGGFLSTGSAGGSLQHDLTDAISWISLVDGKGVVRKLDRGTAAFDAALPSFGLFGIIVEVGFDQKLLPKRFDVAMTSEVVPLEKWGIDPFQKGELAKFFRENEYARLLWWPQPHVNKVEAWTGQRVPPDPTKKNSYVSFSPRVQKIAHALFLHVVDDADLRRKGIDSFLKDLERGIEHLHLDVAPKRLLHFNPHLRALRLGQAVSMLVSTLRPISRFIPNTLFVGALLNAFLWNESQDDLQDIWYRALPHDNQIDDNAIPVVFTEMWMDLDDAHNVMRTLRRLYATRGLEATGTLCVEIYAAKKRTAWMSPAHDVDVLRVDPFVFGAGKRTHEHALKFFHQHWEALSGYQFRNHWGKALPPADGPTGVAYRRKSFPRLPEFLEMREKFDPKGIFLNDYWCEHLGI